MKDIHARRRLQSRHPIPNFDNPANDNIGGYVMFTVCLALSTIAIIFRI